MVIICWYGFLGFMVYYYNRCNGRPQLVYVALWKQKTVHFLCSTMYVYFIQRSKADVYMLMLRGFCN
jgi:hypothetical protein